MTVLTATRRCEFCDAELVRKKRPSGTLEPHAAWEQRRYCDQSCATKAQWRSPKTRERHTASRRASAIRNARLCSVEGCVGKHKAHGWCGMHYQRWKETGDPLVSTQAWRSGLRETDELRRLTREQEMEMRFGDRDRHGRARRSPEQIAAPDFVLARHGAVYFDRDDDAWPYYAALGLRRLRS